MVMVVDDRSVVHCDRPHGVMKKSPLVDMIKGLFADHEKDLISFAEGGFRRISV
jgi:hypothetical protein